MRPRTGWEYCAAVRPELARNWSAASQRRFSSVVVAVSFSGGAIQSMGQSASFKGHLFSTPHARLGARFMRDRLFSSSPLGPTETLCGDPRLFETRVLHT